ncbi:MAG: YbjQ family protein [Luteolibacter sp.]
MNPPPLIIVTSGNDVAGHDIVSYLGIVRGIVVRATGIGRGLIGGLRSIGGGNIPEYAAVCEEARVHAYQIMLEHARGVGADAVIAFRYDATEFLPGSTEVLAYGTAVKLSRR